MPKYKVLDHVPEYMPPLRAGEAQLVRLASKLKPGQCLQVTVASRDQAKSIRERMFERPYGPRLRPPAGNAFHVSIRKIKDKEYNLLLWLESTIPNPESPESRKQNRGATIAVTAEPESPPVDEP